MQDEAPDGRFERLKDAERVGYVDGERRSPDDDGESDVHEWSDEVDDFLTSRRDRQQGGRHVCTARVFLHTADHTED